MKKATTTFVIIAFLFRGVWRNRTAGIRIFRLRNRLSCDTKNGKVGSLKVPEQATRILKYYEQFKQSKNDLVFPELKGVDLSDQYVTKKTIGFKISDIQKLQKMYRHSDVKTTINYQQNLIHEDADDALDAVISKIGSKPKPV
jgi:FtsZ-interacting cell division protein ZipA